MKFTEFISEIIKSIWAWVGLFMDIIGAIIYKSPDMMDKSSFANVVQQYWWAWMAIGTFLIIFSAWQVTNKILKEEKGKLSSPSDANTKQLHSGDGDNVARDKNVYYGNSKKKDDEPEVTFPRTFLHNEFHIKKDTAQNVLNFIKNDISSGLWFTGDGNKNSYHVNHKESRFLYLGKDNAVTDGAFFSVTKNGKHFPDLFWISIISTGIGENTLLTVNFETQEKDAVEFFSILKKKLVKHFTIWEPSLIAW